MLVAAPLCFTIEISDSMEDEVMLASLSWGYKDTRETDREKSPSPTSNTFPVKGLSISVIKNLKNKILTLLLFKYVVLSVNH